MSLWKKIVLVNGGVLGGIVISLFIVPPNTPLRVWATVAILSTVVLNYLLLRRRQTANGKPISRTGSTVIIALGFVVLLLDLILRYLHR